MKSASAAEQITRRSQSNLALAFIALPRDRRHDISVFYAFCRLVDDIADEPGRDLTERDEGLKDQHGKRARIVGQDLSTSQISALCEGGRVFTKSADGSDVVLLGVSL